MDSDPKVTKVHVFDEVKKHNHREDCWIIINQKVYDVTSFLDDHPGGDEVILAVTEKDATDEFEDVGHSDSARERMAKYCIGDIDSSTVPGVKKYTPPPQPAQQSPGLISRLLQFLLPLLILGIAFALRTYTKKDD